MTSDVPELSPTDAHSAQSDGRITVVDVREHDERAEVHADGTRHMPLGELPERLAELPTQSPVAFLCRSGGRSAKAAAIAARAGIDARNVTGGTEAWIAAGLPTQTGSRS